MERAYESQPPRLTFTRDFHELLRGDLGPGRRVRLRYDPARIIPPGEPYVFGDPSKPVIVHAAFHAGAPAAVERPLTSATGPLPEPIVDITGQGSMLNADIDIPQDAAELILWFSYTGADGRARYDSEFGHNYRFPFLTREFRLVSADVSDQGFVVEVATSPDVTNVAVHYRIAPTQHARPIEVALVRAADRDEDGWIGWALNPARADAAGRVVTFKMYYQVRGTWYKDDNSGLYYTVPRPADHDVGPPPPRELAESSRAWAAPDAHRHA